MDPIATTRRSRRGCKYAGAPRRAVRCGRSAIALLAGLALALAGCGPSPLRREFEAYRAEVAPLLDKEREVTSGLDTLIRELDEDPRGPRYYPYLERTAAPFYDRFRERVGALTPKDARIASVHADLVAFADLRRRFATGEVRRRDLVRDPAVARSEEAQITAGAAQTDYLDLLRDDGPDPRYSDLRSLQDTVLRERLPAVYEGRTDVEEVAEGIRRTTLPRIREIRDSRYDDDERSKALRRAVVLTDEAMATLVDALPALTALTRASLEARNNRVEADAVLRRVQEGFTALGREK